MYLEDCVEQFWEHTAVYVRSCSTFGEDMGSVLYRGKAELALGAGAIVNSQPLCCEKVTTEKLQMMTEFSDFLHIADA